MRTWARAATLTLCGGPCRGEIAVGEPLLEIRITGFKKIYRRCRKCAGEPVPADLPTLPPAIRDELAGMTRAGAVGLPFEIPTRSQS